MTRLSRQVLTTIALLALLSMTGLLAADSTLIGQVKKASGEAYLVRGGDRIPAEAGAPVQVGDAIETGGDGRLGITMADNTMLAVGPDTRMSLDAYSFDSDRLTGNMLADLQQGTLSVVSGSMTKVSPDALQVKTPSAVLGVRGTELFVRVDGAATKGR